MRGLSMSIAGLVALACVAAVGATPGCGTSGDSAPFSGADGSTSGGGGGGGSGGASGEAGTVGTFPAGDAGNGSGPSSGGAPGCDVSCAAAGGTCTGSTCVLTENPGNVPPATQTQLQGKGSADAQFAWLYPYDKTVFPKGILSPTLQFGGGASEAAYVHITSKTLDYKGYFAGGAAGKLALRVSPKAWVAVLAAVGAGDALTVQVTKIAGGMLSGPIAESWPIAQGTIRGTVFYETYGSQVAGGRNSVGILKLNPGAAQPVAFKVGCGNVCHTVSADGSTIVSATSLVTSGSWSVNGGAARSTAAKTIFTYMGLYPDGSFGMSATNFGTPYAPSATSRLYDTKAGASIPAPGWDSVINAGGTPSFAPDGKQLAFIHEDKDAHTIAKADFDVTTKTFSNITDLASNPAGFAAWPAFTPDGKSVIYQIGSSNIFETDCGNTGDLYTVDVATRTARRLDMLGGYSGPQGGSYLPAHDPGLDFAPTVLVEAVGGYFWAVFTSHRSYGNSLPSKANSDGLGLSNCFSPAGDDANGKLWVAAIDIGKKPGEDPSHPAFYLDGQELQADNLRGYWVLPPCTANGTTCESGDQCCSGFCRGSPATCVSRPSDCSRDYEKCTQASDCCTPGAQCINGRCATVGPR